MAKKKLTQEDIGEAQRAMSMAQCRLMIERAPGGMTAKRKHDKEMAPPTTSKKRTSKPATKKKTK